MTSVRDDPWWITTNGSGNSAATKPIERTPHEAMQVRMIASNRAAAMQRKAACVAKSHQQQQQQQQQQSRDDGPNQQQQHHQQQDEPATSRSTAALSQPTFPRRVSHNEELSPVPAPKRPKQQQQLASHFVVRNLLVLPP